MVRLFVSSLEGLSRGNKIEITDEAELHHLYVRRVSPGEMVGVLNGRGWQYLCRLNEIEKDRATLEVTDIFRAERSGPKFVIACSLIGANRFDRVVESSAEFGIDLLLPMLCDRTVARLEVGQSKGRWQRKAIEVCKQCENLFLPEIGKVTLFSDVVDVFSQKEKTLLLLPNLGARARAPHLFDALHNKDLSEFEYIVIMIGPEGDFSEAELDYALARGAEPISLGDFILRVETASAFSAAISSYFVSCKVERLD